MFVAVLSLMTIIIVSTSFSVHCQRDCQKTCSTPDPLTESPFANVNLFVPMCLPCPQLPRSIASNRLASFDHRSRLYWSRSASSPTVFPVFSCVAYRAPHGHDAALPVRPAACTQRCVCHHARRLCSGLCGATVALRNNRPLLCPRTLPGHARKHTTHSQMQLRPRLSSV